MGFRFDLQNANTVAQLVAGNIIPFFDEVIFNYERGAIAFEELFQITETFQENFFSSDPSNEMRFTRIRSIRNLERFEISEWAKQHAHSWRDLTKQEKINIISKDSTFSETYKVLVEIHKFFKPCIFRTLLLPSFNESDEVTKKFINEDYLSELVRHEPGDPCLILQPKEVPNNNVEIFGAFPGIEVALQESDEWPGILIWTEEIPGIFIPITSLVQVKSVYDEIHRWGDKPRYLVQRMAALSKKFKKSRSAYFMHMSDLHIGEPSIETGKDRLLQLIKEEKKLLSKANLLPYENKVTFYSMITGDLLDRPTLTNAYKWKAYNKEIARLSTKAPFVVRGNHDYNPYLGLMTSLSNRKEKIQKSVLSKRSIEVIDKLKLVIVRIDSNVDADFMSAQGLIGFDQMTTLEHRLQDYISNGYHCVAMLHHHPIPIEEPDWYRGNLFRRNTNASIYEERLQLRDSDDFIRWVTKNKISMVLHGHRHIPNYNKEYNNIHIVGCGSSTGCVKNNTAGKTYLSYNILKYNLNKQKFTTCVMKFEDVLGKGTKDLLTIVLG